jgi:hypothetical protein
MTYSVCGRIAFLVTVGALAAPSCNVLGGSCNCPNEGPASVELQPARTSPIVAVEADPPCKAVVPDSPGVQVSVSRSSPGTCGVRARLENGDTYAFTVQFQTVDLGSCCGKTLSGTLQSTPEPTDAGVDASS